MNRKIQLLLQNRDPIGAATSTSDKQLVAQELVDRAAGAARTRFITVTEGQEAVYQMKSAEARAHKTAVDAGDSIDPAVYPHLQAEAEATGTSIADLASMVLAQEQAWMAVSAVIEGLRLGAKAIIRTAITEPAIRAAVQVAWPKPEQE